MMSNADSNDGAALRKVAVELQSRFHLEVGRPSHETKKTPVTNPEKAEPKSESSVLVNAPLDFELKQLDAQHPYLLSRGFTPETIRHFGLGFCRAASSKIGWRFRCMTAKESSSVTLAASLMTAQSRRTIRDTVSLAHESETRNSLNSERRCFYTMDFESNAR